ncbi:hypothetical protein B8Z50_004798, partial [Escherichia coli]|nr:hypothetical protein [Escherichia coli]
LFPIYYSLKWIFKGQINAAIICYPIFFFFYPLHLIFDITLGFPEFPKKFLNLEVAMKNSYSNYIYFLILVSIITIFLISQRRPRFNISLNFKQKYNTKKKFTVNILIIISILLLSYFLITPTPSIYLIYGKIRSSPDLITADGYSKVAFYSLASAVIIIICRLIDGAYCSTKKRILYLSLILIAIYLNNKRLIFVFIPIYYLVELFIYNNRKKLFNFFISIILFVIAYYLYAENMKFSDKVMDTKLLYFYLRHELSRDDILLFSIYYRIIENKEILEYPGQSFVATILNYFPRELYLDKPYPYGQYLTNSLMYGKLGHGLLGWTVTTSIYDEFISNFSYYGLFIIPIFTFIYLKKIDSIKNIKKKLFFIFLYFLLLIFHTSPYAILIYYAIWLIIFRPLLVAISQGVKN